MAFLTKNYTQNCCSKKEAKKWHVIDLFFQLEIISAYTWYIMLSSLSMVRERNKIRWCRTEDCSSPVDSGSRYMGRSTLMRVGHRLIVFSDDNLIGTLSASLALFTLIATVRSSPWFQLFTGNVPPPSIFIFCHTLEIMINFLIIFEHWSMSRSIEWNNCGYYVSIYD